MGQLTQEHRFLTVTDFGLGKDTFVLESFEGDEFVSDTFKFTLEVLSEDLAVDPDKVVGKAGTVTIKGTRATRQFNGYIKSLEFGEVNAHNLRKYRLEMVPWLWFLKRTCNCRIFQEQNTKEIVTDIFSKLGFSDYDFKAAGGSKREYCVQYNESDFQFVSRLLEEEGITYYFVHTAGKHQMVLVDQPNAYEELEETALEFSKGSQPNSQLTAWKHIHQFRKGRWSLTDYNFLEPGKNLEATSQSTSRFANNGKYEHYEYPGYYDTTAGKALVKVRLEAEESQREIVDAESNCISFYAGGKFTLAKHDTASEQGAYTIIKLSHYAKDTSFFAGEKGESSYRNQLFCVPSDIHLRPLQQHFRPTMRGPQSALVVGPAGEEIYIDEHGRIKVQFYWDREGKNDENSSCFIRVVQSWAGNQWGSSFIPRIGHEVIVNFLDGDPDRPLVTGSVYNGKNKPVYSSKTQSGIKSRSTKGGNAQNFNEFRFEDKKGSEQVYLHAEKDFDSHVENDQSLTVEKNRNKSIGENESYTVGGNRSKTIEGNQSENIGKDKSTDVGGNHTESIAKNMSTSVGKNITIDIGENHTESIGKNMTISVDKDLKENVQGKYTEKVTKEYGLSAKSITLQADDQITLKTGSASIVMKKNGDITISGKNINVKGSGNVVIKGSKVTAN